MRIGELARQAGVTPKAVRFYERAGLLPPAARAPNGYRVYTAADLARLRFIVRMRRLGLTVADLRDLLRLAAQASPEEFRALLASLLRARAHQLESEIAALVRRHEEYQALVRRLLDERFPPPGRCGCARDPVTCRCSQVA